MGAGEGLVVPRVSQSGRAAHSWEVVRRQLFCEERLWRKDLSCCVGSPGLV